MTLFNIKKESKGTRRFTVIGKQGFYRRRRHLKRWGFGNVFGQPSSFHQLHLGKFTIAIERRKGRDLFGFATNAQ